jgi:fucose permease
MVTMLIGYMIGIILIPRILSYRQVLTSSALLGVVFSLTALFLPSGLEMTLPLADIRLPYTVLFIALLGFANAMIWPSIWPLAIHNLGRFISQGSALMIMAIAGGAVLPLIWGLLSDSFSSRQAYWILIPAYLIVLFYALIGYRIGSWKKASINTPK